jgi:RNA polymerase sigma-70 factor (ECF subfamily)
VSEKAKQASELLVFPVGEKRAEPMGRSGAARLDRDVNDASLARAALEGQAWAEREIWFRFAPTVYGLLRRSLGPRHDAEDLTQEVFLRVFKRLHTIEKPEALRGFVCSFAIRVVSEEVRRHSIRSRLTSLFVRHESEPSVPHADFESRELLQRVESVMDRMNPRQRAVFVLRHIEGVELTEVAATLDLSLATVKRDLEKSRQFITSSIRCDQELRTRLDLEAAESLAREEP